MDYFRREDCVDRYEVILLEKLFMEIIYKEIMLNV